MVLAVGGRQSPAASGGVAVDGGGRREPGGGGRRGAGVAEREFPARGVLDGHLGNDEPALRIATRAAPRQLVERHRLQTERGDALERGL
jgi:hypothetical protein